MRVVRTAMLFETGLILVAAILDRLLGTGAIGLLQVRGGLFLLGAIAAVPPLVLLWWSLHSKIPGFVELREVMSERVLPLFRGANPVEMVVLATAAGVGEELLFRGVLQPLIVGWVGVVAGIALAATLFGLAHFVTRTYAVLAGFIGAYLGVVVLLTGSLIPAMVSHGVYDLVALRLLLHDPQSRGPGKPGDEADRAPDL